MGQDRDDLPGQISTASPLAALNIVVAAGDGRQFNLAMNISFADPPDLVNEMIDRATQMMDRQKARYDLERLENEFEEAGRHLHNFLNAIPVAEQTAKHQLAVLQSTLSGQRDAREDAYKSGYEAHLASGRRGTFAPAGHLRQKLAAMDAEIKKTEEAILALPNDLAQTKQTTFQTIYKYQDDLKKRRKAINDLRRQAGLEPNILFMDEQEAKVEG